jgi:lysophospholipase L1-like esterase
MSKRDAFQSASALGARTQALHRRALPFAALTRVCAVATLTVSFVVSPASNGSAVTVSLSASLRTQAQNANVSVIMFGDSITQGWSQQAPAFFEGRPYANKGISGNTTGQMLQRFKADVLSRTPAVVVILGGINDLASGTDAKTVAALESNISTMIDQAKRSRIRVVVASILPVGYEPEGMQVFAAKRAIVNQTIRQINARFKKLAAAKKVGYLNYYSALTTPAGELLRKYNADNVHITADAYAVMGPLADQAIAATLS